MKCPACSNEMTQALIKDVTLDVCEDGCGGIWFDWFELNRVDEPHEAMGADVLHVAVDESIKVNHDAKRQCPRCDSTPLMKHFASVKREFQVDECPRCAGYFLDYGELNKIQDQYDTEEERSAAAQAMFSDLFDEGLDDIADESEDKLEKAKRLAHMFRFLLPSYYIPGKQKWGAF
ncbi:MAG: zf-TFIIB domain-containing protein [Candidatus Krumholzibacteriota bacterium]